MQTGMKTVRGRNVKAKRWRSAQWSLGHFTHFMIYSHILLHQIEVFDCQIQQSLGEAFYRPLALSDREVV